MRLKNKIVILTGASSGIGRATALSLAAQGAQVVAVARRTEKLKELENESAKLSGKIFALTGDVSKDEDIARVVDTTIEKYGRVDVLINNAGIIDRFLSAHNMEDDVWNKVMDVNVTGPMKLIKKVLVPMLKQGSGNIINTASVGGLFGAKGGLAYVASKHAIIGMTKHIGVIYADKGIRCNAIAPGSIKTEIGQNVQDPNMDVLNKVMKSAEAFPALGESDDIANLMVFLASDESKFINATTIVSDGGWTAL